MMLPCSLSRDVAGKPATKKQKLNIYMTVQELIIFSIFALLAIALWQHLNISQAAHQAIHRYAQQHNLILLDQSVVLERIRLKRSKQSLFAIERKYRFEFSPVANTRYTGTVTYLGKRQSRIELPAHRFYTEDDAN